MERDEYGKLNFEDFSKLRIYFFDAFHKFTNFCYFFLLILAPDDAVIDIVKREIIECEKENKSWIL